MGKRKAVDPPALLDGKKNLKKHPRKLTDKAAHGGQKSLDEIDLLFEEVEAILNNEFGTCATLPQNKSPLNSKKIQEFFKKKKKSQLGAIRHSPVPPTDPFAPLACSCQLDPPAPDSNTAPRGLRSARTRAAPLRHPTPTDHQSRYSLTKVYRGSPGYVFLYSLRFFRVCQGPELHLQSNSLAVCSRDAPSLRRRVAPTLSLGLAPSPILSRGPRPCPRIAPQDVSTVGPSGPNRQLRRSGGDSSGVPRCPRADRPRAASVRSPARGQNPNRGPAPVFSWGRPPPGALPRHTPAGRNHSRALGPLPALPQPRGDLSGVPRRPAPSALTPCQIAAPTGNPAAAGGLLWRPCCPRADRPRAASVRSPTRGHDLDRGPAPVFSWGCPPPGALPRRTPIGRNHSRALGPLPAPPPPQGGARPGSPAAAGGGSSGVPRRPAPSALTPRRIAARREAAASPRAQASGSRAHQRADFAPRHSPGSPRGPTLARPLPPAQPLRSDLDRPGEGAISDVFSPAPPEREIQACAISGSLATPPWQTNLSTLLHVCASSRG
ncbi:hypothetical protein NDU88_002687 [Pleurodeles waltl]|uniref:Uncharacterized protein n=1 Tax=Pleurodeles waltl TaxID=8319 RepID=A0AAV7P9T1_PLEWA|nr:hypothetical protein NDU88_002687 [Pleurodeles waltl]